MKTLLVVSARVALAVGVGATLAACSGSPEPTETPSGLGWDSEFANALSRVETDFQREVLSDHVVTREEYDEAFSLFMDCMERTYPPDGLVKISLIPNFSGFNQVGVEGTSDIDLVDMVMNDCRRGTVDWVELLYVDTTLNPDNRDWVELSVECLIREGVVDEPYTVEQFYVDMMDMEGIGGTDEFFVCSVDPRPKDGA